MEYKITFWLVLEVLCLHVPFLFCTLIVIFMLAKHVFYCSTVVDGLIALRLIDASSVPQPQDVYLWQAFRFSVFWVSFLLYEVLILLLFISK